MEEDKKLGKGIFEQIRDITYSPFDGKLSIKDIEKFFDDSTQAENKRRKELIKQQKENFKHLVKRSKELNKEIPIELQFMTDPFLNKSGLVSKEFFDKYEEWF